MSVPSPEAGWTRFLVKSKLGVGRDFTAMDPGSEQVRYVVDGKIGPRPKADVLDASQTVLYQVTGKLLGIPKRMTISDAGGQEVASLKAKAFSPIKTRMTLTPAQGDPWELEGSILEKDYSITRSGSPIVHITQKWVTIRDTYTLDVADGVEPAFALAVLWAVDRWVERD